MDGRMDRSKKKKQFSLQSSVLASCLDIYETEWYSSRNSLLFATYRLFLLLLKMKHNKIKKKEGYLDWYIVGVNCLSKQVI